MEFIGDDGIPAKLLKDCVSSISKISKWISYYVEVIKHMRTMYQICKLVHGDLSEFNILLHKGLVHNFVLILICRPIRWAYFEQDKGVLYIIDVSQSVEHDHPFALDFLRFDCRYG